MVLPLIGCKPTQTSVAETSDNWYVAWISVDHGEVFHSELSLAAGEKRTITISSRTPQVIGYIVEKGFEVSKSSGTIYMGSEDKPHAVGGSPGTWMEFVTENGQIEVLLENTSDISTKLAVYTKTNK